MRFSTYGCSVLVYCLLIVLLAIPVDTYAQQQQQIQILDSATDEPIIGAYYKYGDQKGSSDQYGMLKFQYEKNLNMELSHISYGSWSLTSDQLLKAIETGVYYREPRMEQFQPVTVIAVHPKREETEQMEFGVREKMAHDGGAILNNTPAISSIRKSGSYGFDPVLRGFKYDQLNVVINGAQTSIAACPNRMDPPTSQMAPNMMERVEVMKGPHALRFGNGLGGTINFVSAKPEFSGGLNTYGRISGGNEFNGTVRRSEGLIGIRNQNVDLSLYASWSEGNDYEDGNGTSVASDFLRGSFGSNLGLKISEQQKITLSGTYNVARDAEFAALPMDLRDDDTWMLNLSHSATFDGKMLQSIESTLFGTFVDHLMDNRLKSLEPRRVNASTQAKTKSYGGRSEATFRTENRLFYVGADHRAEQAEGTRVREFLMGPMAGKTANDNAWQDGIIQKTGLFAEYHIMNTPNTMKWVISGRIERNSSDLNDAASEFTEIQGDVSSTQWNPAISLGGIRNLSSRFSIGLWLGRSQRSGSLTERYINYFPVGLDPFEMLGNPGLDPEVNNQADLTLEYRTISTRLQFDFFASYLQDYISGQINPDVQPRLPMSPGVREYINIDEAFKTGFEFGWSQALFDNFTQTINAAFTYGQDLVLDEPLPEIAPMDFRYTLNGSFWRGRLNPEISLRHATSQERISDEFGENTTPSFTVIDLSLDVGITRNASVSAGVENLLDEAYYEHLSRSARGADQPAIFAPGRSVFLTFNLDFM
jgi:iron complex outermembrane receptor protein